MSPIIRTEDEYEDLLGLWSDLESGLGMMLNHPDRVQEFQQRLRQYDRWMQDLIQSDTEVALYLLFQLASHSPVGYSGSHALVCAVLSHLLAQTMQLPTEQRDSLVQAAFTMNIAITALQDQLAIQHSRPTPEQALALRAHETDGARMLSRLGVDDTLTLGIVRLHHQIGELRKTRQASGQAEQLAHILNLVDRYAALISPRQSRDGRSAIESAHNVTHSEDPDYNRIGQTLLHIVGLYPPGTFVQLDDGAIAIVMHRGVHPEFPEVAVVINSQGQVLRPPTRQPTTEGHPQIATALVAASVQDRLNHHLILQLGAYRH